MKRLLLLIFLSLIYLSFAFPAENDEPTAKKCQVSQEFLSKLKNLIMNAVRGSEQFPVDVDTSGHGDCEQDLKDIVASLVDIHNETAQIKAGGRTTDEVQELKDSFQEKIEKLTKDKDVFELDIKQETLKKEGEMYDKIHSLKRRIQDLKQKIREAEEEFYNLAFELIGHKLETDEISGKELGYASMIPISKFGEFFRHIVTKHDYKVLYDAMYLLQYVYDPQYVFYEYLEEFEERPFQLENENHKMVLTFLCWSTNQIDNIQRHIFLGCERYYMYNLTTHFFPTSDDGAKAVKVAEPVLKGMPDTCNINSVNSYIKDFTTQKSKEKYDNLNQFSKCDQYE